MNRKQRREEMKKGSVSDGMDFLQSPCTIAETMRIARAAAEDVMTDYHQHSAHLRIALSLQVEILKDLVINAGLITEEEFKNRYAQQVAAFNEMQKKATLESEEESKVDAQTSASMTAQANDIEVTLVEGDK